MASSLEPMGDSIYAATKAGIISLANVMAKEFSFNDLDEQLTKINPKGSVISTNSYSRIDE